MGAGGSWEIMVKVQCINRTIHGVGGKNVTCVDWGSIVRTLGKGGDVRVSGEFGICWWR